MKKEFLLMIAVIMFSSVVAQNRSLDLTGSDDYVEVPAFNQTMTHFTVEGWIKTMGSQEDWSGVFFARGGNTTAGINLQAGLKLGYHWNGQNWNWESGHTLTDGQWSHIALVVEPDKATLYLDGVPSVNVWGHAGEEFDGAFFLGKDPNQDIRNYNGIIDEVRFWSVARTEQQIKDNMNKELANPASEAELLAYYQFNDNADDIKGSHDATLVNGVAAPYKTNDTWESSATAMKKIEHGFKLITQIGDNLLIESGYIGETLCIYSVAGACVLKEIVSEGKSIISVGHLSGLFIVTLTQNGEVYSHKIMLKK